MKEEHHISQELLERTERYLENSMSQHERLDFELQLQENAQLRSDVEDIKILLLGIENQSLKERLDVFHEDLAHTPEVTKGKSQRFAHWRKFAAAAIILLAVTSFWWFNNPSNERLYADYFEPDPGLPTVMSNTDAETFSFYDAMVNYKQGDYRTAIDKWETLKLQKPDSDTLNYFLGVAHLANNDEKAAISFLEKAANHSDFALNKDAYYYLGLAYLKADNTQKAIAYLEKSDMESSKELLLKLKD
ncbi:tol-pal system YbgF family protein [Sediminibacter sp. Hel_I_10]|uniref:tetratricopeptide repeat protein n=1 Tax=Sediminibacter sp. Hel_I_10 TaxID=1392490 RepID=UPI00047EB6C9|nr:tetratricopeptide repeat protein [Sediminibacter sp. Hel_I_10]